jgi:hypothetical protein
MLHAIFHSTKLITLKNVEQELELCMMMNYFFTPKHAPGDVQLMRFAPAIARRFSLIFLLPANDMKSRANMEHT